MPTTHRDLRGGQPLWSVPRSHRFQSRQLNRSEDCEVCIVGGGVSGALTALVLIENGIDCVIVDRRQPGSGSTAASTAMIQFELDTPLTELCEKIGSRRANRAYRRSFAAVQRLKRVVETYDLDVDWVDRDALYLAGNEMGFRALQVEAQRRASAGLPSEYLSSKEVAARFGIERTGAILSSGAAELDPARLTAGALRAAVAGGCRIYHDCEVIRVQSDAGGVTIETRSGREVAARKVIFATGYETIDGLPKGLYDITSSWAIATQPLPDDAFWPTRCLIWEAADPYLYLRATADNRILVGGEDSALKDPKRRDAAIKTKSEKLLRALNRLLPGRSLRIDYAWAGAFATSPTGLPLIAPIDEIDHAFAILGCGGNGITFSMVAADICAAWVQGRRDPDASLFARAGR